MITTILMIVAIIGAFFDGVNSDSVEKSQDIPITFQLPKVDDIPIKYEILGIPFEVETPKSKYNKKSWKMPVSTNEINGEIWIGDSLIFQIAVAMKKLDLDYSEKNLKKLIGKSITVWQTQSEKDGNKYYNCVIE